MKVLVTFAVSSEFAPWRARHKFVPVRAGDLTLHQSRIAETQVTVLVTGVGRRNSGLAAISAFIARIQGGPGFDVCISSGLAGALRSEYELSDILVARVVRGSELKEARNEISSDSDLLRIAAGCGAKIVANFYTSETVVQTASEKARLGMIADAVEMESFEILQEASAWGARAVAIRSISDECDEDLPLDFNQALTEKGEVNIPNILAQVAKQPQKLFALVRFGGQSRRAATVLADFLDRYIAALAAADLTTQPASETLVV